MTRRATLLVALALVVSGGFGWLMWALPLGEKPSAALDDLVQLAAALVAAAASAGAGRKCFGRYRSGWALLSAGTGAWALGELAWSVMELGLGMTLGSPTLADIGFLAAVPLEIAAVLTFPLTPGRPAAVVRTLLDGLLIATSLFLISYILVLRAVIDAGHATPFGVAVNLAYPVGDLAIASVVFLALSRVPRAFRLPLVVVSAGLLAIGVSDSYFAYGMASGTYHSGSALDAGWVAGFLLVAVAAAVMPAMPRTRGAHEPEGSLQAAIPYLVFVLTIAVTAIYFIRGGTSDAGIRWTAMTVCSIAAIGLLVHRQDLLQMLRRSREAEAALTDSQALLRRVLETAPIAIFSLDRDGRVRISGGRVLEALDGPTSEAGTRFVGDLLKDFPEAVGMVEKALSGERSSAIIDAWPNQFEIRCDPVFDDAGQVESVTGVAVDVTAEHSLQRVATENEAKSRLLATVSHELRTPLNSVLGFADLLGLERNGHLSDKQRRYLGHIESGGQYLLHLVNEILDFSRLAAGVILDVQPGVVGAAEAGENALDRVRPLAGARELRLAEVPDLPPVTADPRRLDQILLNLLSNAISCTADGGHILLSLASEGEWVDIVVTDDGVGIPEADLDRIFVEYAQTAGGASRGGTGLGLPVSRRLAEAMGGSLTATSEAGIGSSFRLRLRAAVSRSV